MDRELLLSTWPRLVLAVFCGTLGEVGVVRTVDLSDKPNKPAPPGPASHSVQRCVCQRCCCWPQSLFHQEMQSGCPLFSVDCDAQNAAASSGTRSAAEGGSPSKWPPKLLSTPDPLSKEDLQIQSSGTNYFRLWRPEYLITLRVKKCQDWQSNMWRKWQTFY